ncbi:unnamed protein product [Paramecium pentaurelia]|uniref:RNA helicase n=1 Tax=Paramecium pentaurelia TaxID=43138 RepID=A0A8S1SD60_9CILI|nr:unnamed protein product [Paramecium pentaurelia]
MQMDEEMLVKKESQVEDIVRKKVRTQNDNLGDYIPLQQKQEVQIQQLSHLRKRVIKPLTETERKALPIYNLSHKILEEMQNNQVIVITGGTGCGKSTQVPQMILRHHTNTEFETPRTVNILCTQPRRLAAKSLAKRVASELDCQLGTLVGYQVGMDSQISSRQTQIQFVTTGIFLQKLVHDREGVFRDYSHIIMDEVHERDIDIDFCLIIIKNLLKYFKDTKLILMSATICSDKFANYFSKKSINLVDDLTYIQRVDRKYKYVDMTQENDVEIAIKFEGEEDHDIATQWGQSWKDMDRQVKLTQEQRELEQKQNELREIGQHFLDGDDDAPAPIIKVPMSQKYPIETYYMEEIHSYFNDADTAKLEPHQPLRFQTSLYFQDTPKIQQDSVQAMLQILEFLDSNKIKDTQGMQGAGAVLIFLPGYQEIMDIREEIYQKFGEDRFIIIILHSTVTIPKDFDDIQKRKRRLILSTNVAESSITVPDCKFVIDFCLTKEIIYNPKNLTEKLALQYCSKASADQRKGRTGRLFPGTCFRLIPQSIFKQKMTQYSVCEMLRCPLEIIILRLKKLYQLSMDNENKTEKLELNTIIDLKQVFNDPGRTLKTAIDPPSTKQIENAISNLQMLGALSYPNAQNSTIHITRLGQMMSDMPIDIFLTRFIMYCNIIGCAYEGVTIAAILSQRKNYFLHHFMRSQKLFFNSLYLYDKGNEDDLLIQLRVYQEWEIKFFNILKSTITQHELKRELKRFTNRNIGPLEKLYCEQRSIDPKNMREILNVKYELFMRLDQQFKNEPLDLSNPENQLKIKSAFCAAFKQNTFRLAKDERYDKKIKYLKDQGFDYTRTIMLESDNIKFDGVNIQNKELIKEKIAMIMEQFCDFHQLDRSQKRLEDQLKDILAYLDEQAQGRQGLPKFHFRSDLQLLTEIKAKSKFTKSWVQSVILLNNTIIIEFKEVELSKLKYVLKRLMHECELMKRQQSRKQPQKIFWEQFTLSNQVDIINFIEITQSLIFYGCYCRLIHQHKEINCDPDSINFISLDQNKILVAYEVQEKDSNKRNSTRQVISIDQNKYLLWSQILAMLFGVQVKLYHNNTKTHFIKAKVDDRDYQFDYFITEDDLQTINSIRQQIKLQILEQNYTDSGIWQKIRQLDKVRQKILYTSDERWKQLFDIELKDEILSFQESSENKQKRKRIQHFELEEQKADSLDYMNPIQIIRTDYDSEIPKQFDNEGIKIYVQIQQLYQTWKQNIVNTIKKQNFFLRMGNTTQICCLECNDYMTVGKTIGLSYISEDPDIKKQLDNDALEWAKRMVMILDVSSFGDYFNISMKVDQIKEFLSDQRIQSIFEKLKLIFEPINYVFITCNSGKHIIGFYPKIKQFKEIVQIGDIQKFYIIDQKLKLVYTSMEEEKFVFRKLTIDEIKKKENQAVQQRKLQNLKFTCKCCFVEQRYDEKGYFEGNEQAYSQHIKQESHKKAFEELQFTII